MALLEALSAISSCSRASMPRRLRSAEWTPAIFSGSVTFSRTVWLGVRKNCWNTKPNAELRSSLSCLASKLLVGCPLRATTPWVGASSRANKCMRVDLPEPDLPTTATDSPSLICRFTPFRASNLVSPLPYILTRFSVSRTGAVIRGCSFRGLQLMYPCGCVQLSRIDDRPRILRRVEISPVTP